MRIMFLGRAHKLSLVLNSKSCVQWWEVEPILELTIMQQNKTKKKKILDNDNNIFDTTNNYQSQDRSLPEVNWQVKKNKTFEQPTLSAVNLNVNWFIQLHDMASNCHCLTCILTFFQPRPHQKPSANLRLN